MGGDSVGGGPRGTEGFPERKHDGQKPSEKCRFNLLKSEQSNLLGT